MRKRVFFALSVLAWSVCGTALFLLALKSSVVPVAHSQGRDVSGTPRPGDTASGIRANQVTWSEVITPSEGGKFIDVYPQGNPTFIDVPPYAITETLTLVYVRSETVEAPAGLAFAGHAFQMDAYRGGVLLPGFTFERPVTITIHYTYGDVNGMGENTLTLYGWDEDAGEWQDAACAAYRRNLSENWVAVPICHLSDFALMGEGQAIYLPLVLRNAR